MNRNSFFHSLVILTTIFFLNSFNSPLFSQDNENGSEESDSTGEENTVKEEPFKNGYDKFISGKYTIDPGLFTVYSSEGRYFFELNDTLIGRDMLLGSRISELSSTSKVVAGEMRKSPIMIRFSRDDKNIYMHQIVSDYISDEDDPVSISVKRNSLPPILKVFPVAAMNFDSTAVVFEVTRFFNAEIPAVSPFNAKYKAGKLESEGTFILESQSFPENVEIKTQMNYSNAGSDPFLVIMNRSILLLPQEPMKPRYEDPRIGYFANSVRYFSSAVVGVETKKYISRFNIQPKKEDEEKYRNGEMVEPEKPIIFYVDNAFPESWRPFIKAGIEDWQTAFESIGFRNAIIAKDYPTDDPEFNPEDIRYSCIRYISMPKANSMGPRWIDPRSGEVIGGDVLWWHDVTVLLRDWRFVQCGAAEPAARKKNPDMELLGEMIRYVAAHEVGHTLGLKHNMRASYAFPVDSLRSATFTQKNGTTPSIMDYARFNYIAQPGDNGIRFSPPVMGPYDIFAIKWGYKPIPEAATPEKEKEILNKWILENADNPLLRYGDQQMGLPFDPSSQNEALGDDAIFASTYGVKNAKYIMEHLVDWTTSEYDDFDFLKHMYDELVQQYQRYIGHVNAYLGGVYIYQLVEGENKQLFTPTEKQKQKKALEWLFNELETQHGWILNEEIQKRIGSQKPGLMKSQSATLDNIMNTVILQRLELYHNDYTCREYLGDIHRYTWKNTFMNKALNEFERNLQASYVQNLLTLSGSGNSSVKPPASQPEEASLSNSNSAKVMYLDNIVKPLVLEKIDETEGLLKKHLNDKDPVLKYHYRYLYEMIREKK